MKIKFKNITLYLVLTSLLILASCKKDYLDVADPTVLSEAIFPKTVTDLEPLMSDLYGRFRSSSHRTYVRASQLSHEHDHGYNGAAYNIFMLNEVPANSSYLQSLWGNQYAHIGKCNEFLKTIGVFRAKGTFTAAQLKQLDEMEGQVRYMRAYNYFYLVNYFGEYPVITAADKQKMGVPIWDVAPTSISETTKERATQGAVYDFVIADLKVAETLLKGVVFTQKARITEWAAKSLLGKAYIYNLQYPEAKIVLKDVIDNSGKSLVSFNILLNMFNGQNEFNNENIFEINATKDPLDGTNGQLNTGWGVQGTSASYIDAKGVTICNGFGNTFIHDENLPRLGLLDNATTIAERTTPAYKANALAWRADKSVDPRIRVITMQPYIDSMYITNVWFKSGISRFESYPQTGKKGWNIRKYNIIDYFWSTQRQSGINCIVSRLADVYLMYAEACIKTGDGATGLEYINKVHRRAYDQPVDAPSIYDYASLSARTKTLSATDHLANDPLKYERWAELFGENNWWFDVRRFGLGAQEAAYYKKVMGGTLEWRETKYALAIPTNEVDSNAKLVQNPGY